MHGERSPYWARASVELEARTKKGILKTSNSSLKVCPADNSWCSVNISEFTVNFYWVQSWSTHVRESLRIDLTNARSYHLHPLPAQHPMDWTTTQIQSQLVKLLKKTLKCLAFSWSVKLKLESFNLSVLLTWDLPAFSSRGTLIFQELLHRSPICINLRTFLLSYKSFMFNTSSNTSSRRCGMFTVTPTLLCSRAFKLSLIFKTRNLCTNFDS